MTNMIFDNSISSNKTTRHQEQEIKGHLNADSERKGVAKNSASIGDIKNSLDGRLKDLYSKALTKGDAVAQKFLKAIHAKRAGGQSLESLEDVGESILAEASK